MRDTDLYQRILGLEKPWSIKRVDWQVAENRVDIWLEHPGGAKWPCPKCGQELPCRDHAEERAWRHLDTCQFQTHLYAGIIGVAGLNEQVRDGDRVWPRRYGQGATHNGSTC